MKRAALALMVLSLAVLAAFVILLVALHPAREPDEGTGAHLWQLLMAAQLPVGAFFAIAWLPSAPRASWLLGLQIVGILANLASVRWLGL
jgi:hypothetical protein